MVVEERSSKLPTWHYEGTQPTDADRSYPPLNEIDLGDYCRPSVSNCQDPTARAYFNLGWRLVLSYQHEMAAKCFLACLERAPDCALAHGLVAHCHSPNYNFKGEAYYESACHYDDTMQADLLCVFPSQQVAERHSKAAIDLVEELRKLHKVKKKKGSKGNAKKIVGPTVVADTPADRVLLSDVETQWLHAIRILTCNPGIDPDLADETVGRPFANAMRTVYTKYPTDPDICYCFAESLMVLNAWHLYAYPSGDPINADDVTETRRILEGALTLYPQHAGICHMYVHLMEMSAHPGLALPACESLRHCFPHAGHLIHMPSHVDVLLGNYTAVVEYNVQAMAADATLLQLSPTTAGVSSFYFGYHVHNYHMAVYGCILGAFEQKGRELALELETMVNEDMLTEYPNLVAYLESYSALTIHVLVRFGRWDEILGIVLPNDTKLMLYRTATLRFARALALAAQNNLADAIKEADRLDQLRRDPDAENRILHNNSIARLLQVDATMLRGELVYRQGKYEQAFVLLRKAVNLQDNLNYDEPWGKMQPVRHALGGLLLEQGQFEEAADVFRQDLAFHPKNPWALVGLQQCLRQNASSCGGEDADGMTEMRQLETALVEARQLPLADYSVEVACECCQHAPTN